MLQNKKVRKMFKEKQIWTLKKMYLTNFKRDKMQSNFFKKSLDLEVTLTQTINQLINFLTGTVTTKS